MKILNNVAIIPPIDQAIIDGDYGDSAGLEHLFQGTGGTPTEDSSENTNKK